MENSASLIQVLSFTFGLICLWFAFFYLYRDFCIDSFRQRMFALRDQLFDEAADGLISFDHPAYGLLRKTMNGYLRFGHKFTFAETLLLFFLARKDFRRFSFETRLKEVTSELPNETISRINFFHRQMHTLTAKHMLKSSPVLLTILLVLIFMVFPVIIYIVLHKQIKTGLKNIIQNPIGNLESTALAYGDSQ